MADPLVAPRAKLDDQDAMHPAVLRALDEWLGRTAGIRPAPPVHRLGTFLELLAVEGYRVTPIEESNPSARRVTVQFAGGPWDGKTTDIERVVGPVFAVGDELGNHYWLDTKGSPLQPPTYHWDGTAWEVKSP